MYVDAETTYVVKLDQDYFKDNRMNEHANCRCINTIMVCLTLGTFEVCNRPHNSFEYNQVIMILKLHYTFYYNLTNRRSFNKTTSYPLNSLKYIVCFQYNFRSNRRISKSMQYNCTIQYPYYNMFKQKFSLIKNYKKIFFCKAI